MPLGSFSVEFSTKAVKDLKKVPSVDKEIILNKTKTLTFNPFPRGSRIKKIKGMKSPLYRLRANGKHDSYRIFYGIDGEAVLILRIVSKKEADKIIRSLKL